MEKKSINKKTKLHKNRLKLIQKYEKKEEIT